MFKKLMNTSEETSVITTVIMAPSSPDSIEIKEKSLSSEQLNNHKCTMLFTEVSFKLFKSKIFVNVISRTLLSLL